MAAVKRRIVAVDPALGATGLVSVVCAGPRIVEVVHRTTIRTRPKDPLPERLEHLRRKVVDMISLLIGNATDLVVEDPTDFFRFKGRRGGVRTASVLGAAYGVVAVEVLRLKREATAIERLEFYPSHMWLRRFGNGRLPRHEHMVRAARLLHPALAKARDDEATAAALAITHHYRMEADRVRQTATDRRTAQRVRTTRDQ